MKITAFRVLFTPSMSLQLITSYGAGIELWNEPALGLPSHRLPEVLARHWHNAMKYPG
jgi:hypothetical protein